MSPKHRADAVGNLTQVQETDPNLGTVYTNYTYNVLNQLRTVSMPRGSYTQTRTFTYAAWSQAYGVSSLSGVGPFLISATNPENGTVTTSYGGTLPACKIDAKGQKIAYTYDSYARVTQISKYPDGTNEDLCQRVTYNYDTNPDDGTYSQYASGRLASLHYAGANCQTPSAPVGGSAVSGNNYIETYSYTQTGQVAKKKFRLTKTTATYPSTQTVATGDLEAVYTYDQEGKMLSQSYPLGTTYQYAYDALGRPTKMTDTVAQQDLVSTVSYGPAGELLSMSGTSVAETRTYNANGQLTQLVGINMNLKYNYAAAGANNGQIASQQDLISGETISYAYDSLKRLASASSTQGWGQGFGYDGYGNLTAKTALSGTPPVGSYPADPTTNRLASGGYDANGNTGGVFDVANRMVSTQGSAGQAFFEYDASNKRVFQQRQHYDGNNWVTDATEYYFYGVGGKRLGTYLSAVSGSSISWSLGTTQVFFRGKLLSRSNAIAQEDIRGSVGSYFPFGEERGFTANDVVKFATYTRDSISGLDYAINPYHVPGLGRFSSPDPYAASGGPGDPGSWNRYSYVQGDPVFGTDLNGTDMDCEVGPNGVISCKVTKTDPGPSDPSHVPPVFVRPAAMPNKFWKAIGRISDAIDALEERTEISTDCSRDLQSIAGQRGADFRDALDINSLIGAISAVTIKNGVGSTDPVSSLYTDPYAANGAGSGTIGARFAANPNGLTVLTQMGPGGSAMYINPALISSSGSLNMALLLHEGLHLLGFEDGDLQRGLGLTVDDKNTQNITYKLLKDCVSGKGNR